MAALSADVYVQHGANARFVQIQAVGADVFYKGAIVVYDLSTGYLQVPTGGSADVFAGIVAEQTTTTAQGNEVLVQTEGEALIVYNSVLRADEGDLLFRDISANSDNPGDLHSAADAATADVAIGRIIRIESLTLGGWVRLHDNSAIATGA